MSAEGSSVAGAIPGSGSKSLSPSARAQLRRDNTANKSAAQSSSGGALGTKVIAKGGDNLIGMAFGLAVVMPLDLLVKAFASTALMPVSMLTGIPLPKDLYQTYDPVKAASNKAAKEAAQKAGTAGKFDQAAQNAQNQNRPATQRAPEAPKLVDDDDQPRAEAA